MSSIAKNPNLTHIMITRPFTKSGFMDSVSKTTACSALLEHSKQFKQTRFRLSELFIDASECRFDAFSLRHENLLLDFSKNYLTDQTVKLLVDLAIESDLSAAIEAMFTGAKINTSEQSAALHVALREPSASSQYTEVADTLSKMEELIENVHTGNWLGYTGKKITDVINIGIGGSDLGPALLQDALTDFATGDVEVHFVSNMDPSHLASTLNQLQPETSLFVIASKSFTTLETQQNAAAARRWLLQQAQDETAIGQHFVAVSANLEAAIAFGIDEEHVFSIPDWVGGRYSLWSAIGLPFALSVGMQNFRQLLAGAHSMDQHFRHTEFTENLPVVMALLSVWYTGFFDCHSSAVVPYSQRLSLLPAYLQQLYMESLGKSVDLEGNRVSSNTGEVLWGTAGSNGQHSYFQLLHQGTEFVPVDFIAVANPSVAGRHEQHSHLLANCFSQSLALMEGNADEQEPHKNIPGNKPSNTLLLSTLDPYNLGSLIALYEHKVYVQSVLWKINAFDQWGVELGKKLSKQVFNALLDANGANELDDSTANLIKLVHKWKTYS